MILNAYADAANGLLGVSIHSVGHIFAQSGRRITRPQGREDWLLFYVAKGCERFLLDGTADAGEGSFVLFRPHQRQEHVCISNTAEFYYIHFTAPADFTLAGLASFTVHTAKPSAAVCDLFESILDELQKRQPHYGEICTARLFELAGLLARRSLLHNDPKRLYSDRIPYVIQLMNREYDKAYTLEDFAALCNMSRFHFLRIFREITGRTPLEYRNHIRMEHARELLEDTELPVCEIAARVGFSSASYFCDAFKKKFGLSPLAARRLGG